MDPRIIVDLIARLAMLAGPKGVVEIRFSGHVTRWRGSFIYLERVYDAIALGFEDMQKDLSGQSNWQPHKLEGEVMHLEDINVIEINPTRVKFIWSRYRDRVYTISCADPS